MPKFLDVTNKQAALDAVGIRKFYVDNYGADPSGATSSNSAVTAALAAMGSDPGTLVFGSGTYALSTTINLGPYQSVIGDSVGSTVIDYSGSSDAIRVQDTRTWTGAQSVVPGGAAGPGVGVRVADLIIDGSNAGSAACGLHIGDVGGPHIDVTVINFDGATGKGVWFDNRVTWTEWVVARCFVQNCTEAIVFQADPTKPTASYGYGDFDFYVLASANQTGVRMTNCSLYSLKNFSLQGGFFNDDEAAVTNNGAVLRLTGGVIFDTDGVINVEGANDGSGPPKHKTIVQTGNDNAMFFRGRLHFLGVFADGSGPWPNFIATGFVNIDEVFGRHGADAHAHRVYGGATGTRGATEISGGDLFWFWMSGNWFLQQLPAGNSDFTVVDYGYSLPAGNQATSWHMFLRQPDAANAAVTWPESFVWLDGQAPTLSTTFGAIDHIHITTFDFETFYAEHVTSLNPRLDSAKGVRGGTVLNLLDQPSAVNYLDVSNSATGGGPGLSATGQDTHVDMNFGVKGTNGKYWFYPGGTSSVVDIRTASGQATDVGFAFVTQGGGRITHNGANIPTVSSTDTLTGKTLTDPKINKLLGTNGGTVLNAVDSTGATGYLNVYNGTSDVSLEATGSASTVNLNFSVKGAGGRYWFYPGGNAANVDIRTASGQSTDVGFAFTVQGSGRLTQNGVNIPTVSSTDTLTNKTATSLKLSSGNAPSSNTAAGATGQIEWDASYLYVCTSGGAQGAATWKRVALAADTWSV